MKSSRSKGRAIALLSLALMLSGFTSSVRPVELMPEADECSGCRMAVEEPRLACELLGTDGSVEKFDDIGCMATYVRTKKLGPARIKALFVHDFFSSRWLPLEGAQLYRTGFRTPMRYGILAFAASPEVRRLDAKLAPRPVRWADLVKGN